MSHDTSTTHNDQHDGDGHASGTSGGGGHASGGGPHVVPLPLLAGVFLLLMVLTLLTWGVTLVDFGYNMNLTVAMVIALVKAAFVGLYFMHLRWDAPINSFILVVSLLFVTLFITFTMMDSGQYAPAQEAAAIRLSAP